MGWAAPLRAVRTCQSPSWWASARACRGVNFASARTAMLLGPAAAKAASPLDSLTSQLSPRIGRTIARIRAAHCSASSVARSLRARGLLAQYRAISRFSRSSLEDSANSVEVLGAPRGEEPDGRHGLVADAAEQALGAVLAADALPEILELAKSLGRIEAERWIGWLR